MILTCFHPLPEQKRKLFTTHCTHYPNKLKLLCIIDLIQTNTAFSANEITNMLEMEFWWMLENTVFYNIARALVLSNAY